MPPGTQPALSVLPSNKQEQADGHDRHSPHQAVNYNMFFPVFPCCRQQFVKGNENHDAGHKGEKEAQHRVPKKRCQKQVADQSPYRLRNTRKQCIPEGLAFITRIV